jgi:hypothetical protein
MDFVAACRKRDTQLGRNDTAAAVRGVAGNADFHEGFNIVRARR